MIRLRHALVVLSLVSACARADDPSGPLVTEIGSPAAAGSSEANLAAGPDGDLHVSWTEPVAGGGHALRFASLGDGGWSEPRTIASGTDWFVNWADFPSLVALGDGRMAAHWLQRSGSATYAYDVRVAVSSDGGERWTDGASPHGDGTQTEHGFVSMWGARQGGVALVWLDGRNTGGGHDGHGGGAMTLRHGVIGADGVPLAETEIDDRVCDCCQTGAAMTSRGPVVVYRGRTAEEVRDVLVTRLVDGAWTAGSPVHADGWVIHGCPVNGPQVSASGDRVAVAWFAAPGDSARVQVALSDDAGAAFGAPVRIDDGQPLGRVDVLLLEDGDALVSWLERVEDGSAEIRVRRVAPSGAVGAAGVVARSSAARASGFPRMARGRAGVMIAWTAAGDSAGVRTARLDPAALERPR